MAGISRITQFQQLHYFRKRVNYNDVGIAAGVIFGTLPAGAMLHSALCRVNVAFNAVTTNVLTVGLASGSFNEIIAAADVTEATPATYAGALTNSAFSAAITVDTDIGVKYTQTGTAATTGQADILVSYAPNNDQ